MNWKKRGVTATKVSIKVGERTMVASAGPKDLTAAFTGVYLATIPLDQQAVKSVEAVRWPLEVLNKTYSSIPMNAVVVRIKD